MSGRRPLSAARSVAFAGGVPLHVDYVTDGPGSSVDAFELIARVLSDPLNLALMGVVGTALAAALAGYLWFRPAAYDIAIIRHTFEEYNDLIPWMLRLSVGLPLVGAGFAGYFFSPAVPAQTRLFQVALGFLLLFGLWTRLVALVGLVAYLIGLVFNTNLFLASEYVGGLVAIIILGGGRPSADQVLKELADHSKTILAGLDPARRVTSALDSAVAPYEEYAVTAVRVGLGFNFAYLGLTQKLLDPGRALQVVEKYDLTSLVPVDPGMWVVGVGLTEIALGLVLFVGLFTRAAASVAFFMFSLTLFGLADDPVLAHITLFGMASALVIAGSGPLGIDNKIRGRTESVDTSTAGSEKEPAPEPDAEKAAES